MSLHVYTQTHRMDNKDYLERALREVWTLCDDVSVWVQAGNTCLALVGVLTVGDTVHAWRATGIQELCTIHSVLL